MKEVTEVYLRHSDYGSGELIAKGPSASFLLEVMGKFTNEGVKRGSILEITLDSGEKVRITVEGNRLMAEYRPIP